METIRFTIYVQSREAVRPKAEAILKDYIGRFVPEDWDVDVWATAETAFSGQIIHWEVDVTAILKEDR